MPRTRRGHRTQIRRHLTNGNRAAALTALDAYRIASMTPAERIARATAPLWRLPAIRHAIAFAEWGGQHARYTIPVATAAVAAEITATWPWH